ncbi:MAG: hypothetical protein ACYDA8_06065 [Deferrisomatales bacterium]
MATVIKGAVEGVTDEAVLRRLIEHVGALPGDIYGREGKAQLLKRLPAFNSAARFEPWLVLVDLDHDEECAPPARRAWLADPAPRMQLRIAVPEVEAWLLADRERTADWLGVRLGAVPEDPESLGDPKRVLVDLCQRSSRRAVRQDIIPRPGSGRAVGPGYVAQVIQFAGDAQAGWRPEAAAERAPSLGRCLLRLRELAEQAAT